MNTQLQRGFTVIEMMIGIAVFAVMLTLAVPMFTGLTERNRTVTAANSFLNALSIARSEAVKRNQRVKVCGKPIAQAACNTTGNWEQGWTVFVDADSDNVPDAGEEILVDNGLPSGFTLREPSADYGDVITFRSTGETVEGSAVQATFRLCTPDANTTLSRTININVTGRAVVTQTTTACP